MRDIVVTTPKNMMETAAQEARDCIEAGGGQYFRTFRDRPRDLEVGSRIFYVEDGYVRGFAVVRWILHGTMLCRTTGKDWGVGYHVTMSAASWKWIEPIPMKGFQGFRYCDLDFRVVGDWLDPRPAAS